MACPVCCDHAAKVAQTILAQSAVNNARLITVICDDKPSLSVELKKTTNVKPQEMLMFPVQPLPM